MARTLIPMTDSRLTYTGTSWRTIVQMGGYYSFTYPAYSNDYMKGYTTDIAPFAQPAYPNPPVPIAGDGPYNYTNNNGDSVTLTFTQPASPGHPYIGALLLCRMDLNPFTPTIQVDSLTPITWHQWNMTFDGVTYNAVLPYQPFLYRACSPPLSLPTTSGTHTITLTAAGGGATFVGAELYTAESKVVGSLLTFGHSIVYGSYLYGSPNPNFYPGVVQPGGAVFPNDEFSPANRRFPDKLASMLGMTASTAGYPAQSINDAPPSAPPPGWLYVDDGRILGITTGTQTATNPVPDVAVIMHGYNDNLALDTSSNLGYSRQRLIQRLKETVYRLNLNCSATHVVLAGITYDDHDPNGAGYETFRMQANTDMQSLANDPTVSNCIYAETRQPMAAVSPPGGTLVGGIRSTIPATGESDLTWHQIPGSSPVMLQGYGEQHPNGVGTDIIAQAIDTAIKKQWP